MFFFNILKSPLLENDTLFICSGIECNFYSKHEYAVEGVIKLFNTVKPV